MVWLDLIFQILPLFHFTVMMLGNIHWSLWFIELQVILWNYIHTSWNWKLGLGCFQKDLAALHLHLLHSRDITIGDTTVSETQTYKYRNTALSLCFIKAPLPRFGDWSSSCWEWYYRFNHSWGILFVISVHFLLLELLGL